MKKLYIVIILGLLLIAPVAIATEVFYNEAAARNYKNNFKDYPTTTGKVNITKIESKLDSKDMIITWELPAYNNIKNRTDVLSERIYLEKSYINDTKYIESKVKEQALEMFKQYNDSFIPRPSIHHTSNSLWGKTIDIFK